MKKLSKPDKILASRILSEVDFSDRLIGYRMRLRSGPAKTTMYSFEEVVHFLSDDIPVIEFDRLEQWIRTVIKDEELAAQIPAIIARENSDQDRSLQIKHLMRERLNQCIEAKRT